MLLHNHPYVLHMLKKNKGKKEKDWLDIQLIETQSCNFKRLPSLITTQIFPTFIYMQ